jgi:hypothetical protein
LKIVIFTGLIVGLTGCERPANISPIGPAAPAAPVATTAATIVPAEPKAVTPTLLIKTPVKVATQASGFQEILSATQTAVATIRSGTLTATALGFQVRKSVHRELREHQWPVPVLRVSRPAMALERFIGHAHA